MAGVPAGRTGGWRGLRPRGWIVPALGAAGLGLLVWLVASLGPARIAAQLRGLGPILPIVLVLTAAKYPLQAAGWRLLLPVDRRPPWGASVAATITGDALGYLTWAGPVTGEPMRALLVRDSVPVAAGTAAGAMERAIYNATAALLVWTVLFVLLAAAHTVAMVAALGASVAAGVYGVIRIRRRVRAEGPEIPKARVPADEPGEVPPRGGEAVEASGDRGRRGTAFFTALRELWRHRRGALPLVTLLCLAQHAVLVSEAYVILRALDPAATLGTALVFEAVTKIINTAGLVVPGRIGVAEGGSALLADALGFAASQGLSLALMRRVRALVWAGVGLGLLPFREARARSREGLSGGR